MKDYRLATKRFKDRELKVSLGEDACQTEEQHGELVPVEQVTIRIG